MECWLFSFVAFQGIRTSITKEPYSLVIFLGGGGSRPPANPPLDPRMAYDKDTRIQMYHTHISLTNECIVFNKVLFCSEKKVWDVIVDRQTTNNKRSKLRIQ